MTKLLDFTKQYESIRSGISYRILVMPSILPTPHLKVTLYYQLSNSHKVDYKSSTTSSARI